MSTEHDPATEPRPGVVLDPKWEQALRAGQQAEGEQGSVEDELAIVHLLRHAAAPHALDDEAFDRVWDDLDGALDEQAAASGWGARARAWLSSRPWLALSGVGVAAAAAAVLVVVWPGDGQAPVDTPSVAAVTPDVGSAEPTRTASLASTIEAQFAMLEPAARSSVERSVNDGRADLRGELVAEALRADGRSMGGAR